MHFRVRRTSDSVTYTCVWWFAFVTCNIGLAIYAGMKIKNLLKRVETHMNHPTSPTGSPAFCVNTGLQDSDNLAWKLGLVLDGMAPESILETYKVERKLVPDETYTVGHHARDGDLHVVKKGGLIKDGTEDGTENGTKLRMHELTVGPGIFHVLVFAANMLQQTKVSVVKGNDTASSKDLADNVHKHLQRRSKVFMIHVIASDLTVPKNASPVASAAEGGNVGIEMLADSLAGDDKLFLDQQGAMHQKYGVAKHGAGALVVMRPYGHLGYHVKGTGNTAWEDVDGYFRSIL
ncbi:hypothetical protein BG005_004150, partial [Podila minutissima]